MRRVPFSLSQPFICEITKIKALAVHYLYTLCLLHVKCIIINVHSTSALHPKVHLSMKILVYILTARPVCSLVYNEFSLYVVRMQTVPRRKEELEKIAPYMCVLENAAEGHSRVAHGSEKNERTSHLYS